MSKRIFIADHDEENLSACAKALMSANFDVFEATNGKELLKIINVNNVPHGIFVNSMLSEVEAIEVCKTIKADKRTANVPIVVIKDKGFTEAPYKELGISVFLNKPVEITSVLNTAKALTALDRSQIGKKSGSPFEKIALAVLGAVCLLIVVLAIIIPMINGLKAGK